MTVPQQREPEPAENDLDIQSPAADLVRVYLNGIGRTALLTAAQEVELAKRIEAGVFAQHMLETESRGTAKLGRTLSMNPGSSYTDGVLQGAVLDLNEKKGKVTRYILVNG
jgi:RNA polymerase nonessential primary-like sigma factor